MTNDSSSKLIDRHLDSTMSSQSTEGSTRATTSSKPKSLRSACDTCHQSKIKCSGRLPCQGCEKLGVRCKYSISNRTGRPKGVRNKKTLERIKHMSMNSGSSEDKPDSEESSFPAQEITPKENADPLAHSFLEAGFHPYSDPSDHAETNITGSFPGIFSLQDIPEYLNGGLGDFGSGEKHAQYEEKILSPSTLEAMSTQNLLGAMGHDFSWGLHLDTAQTFPPTRNAKGPNPTNINKDNTITCGTSPKQNTRITRESSSSRSRTPSITTCDCLQQLADQLAQIKGLNRASELLKADYILSVAREALHRWRSQLQCNICQQNDDRDILVLSVMGFRAILSLIRRIGQDILGSPVDSQQTSPVRGQDSHLLNEELTTGDASITSAGLNGSSDQSFLGIYELSQEEKRLMANVLLNRALSDIGRTVEDVKARSAKRPILHTPSSSDCSTTSPIGIQFPFNNINLQASGDKHLYHLDGASASVPDTQHTHLQHSLQSLSRSIESLSDALRHQNSSPAPSIL